MCLGIPGRVVELLTSDLALVDVVGVPRRINTGLVTDGPLAPGDWVLIHVGFALSRMGADEAEDAMGFLRELADGA